MNEVGTSLTMTGLIATVVSVLFAIAALYVSHRRRVQPGTGVAAPYVSHPTHITPSQPRKAAATIPMTEMKPAPEIAPTTSQPAFNMAPGSAPLFKKLGGDTPSAAPEPKPASEKSQQYTWE